MEWISLIDEEQIIAWRRWFHQHPELSFQEYETSRQIKEALDQMDGMETITPTKTSVVGILKGGRPGKTIGLRADIDALPVEEKADVAFRSLYPGVMHACGHDAHAAMLLGAATVLSRIKEEFSGTIKFIFQHAEEVRPGGAIQIIETGCLDDVDLFFGEHIYARYPTGLVASTPGPCLAASDGFALTIQGRGSHGSMPQHAIDPIMIGSSLVLNLNQIVSRDISPLDSVVLSIGEFISGTKSNIIPDTAKLSATVRTYTKEDRDYMENRVGEICDGICGAHGASYTMDYTRGYGAVVNDAKSVAVVKKVAEEILGPKAFMEMPKQMGSEDFSAYLEKAPGVYVIIAGGAAAEGYAHVNHSPEFIIDEKALVIGTKMHIGFALEVLK